VQDYNRVVGSLIDDLTEGVRAFKKGRYVLACQKLLPLAEQGELRAQVIIARLYYAGNGVERDHEKYVYWLQRAADSGDKSSKSQLKRLSQQGQNQ
jgi:TPR repeat protein